MEAVHLEQEGPPDPYRLRVVGHSLGGAALLIYAVMSRKKGRRHHIYRLILLTPAGFLQHAPKVSCVLFEGWVVRTGDLRAVAKALVPRVWLSSVFCIEPDSLKP